MDPTMDPQIKKYGYRRYRIQYVNSEGTYCVIKRPTKGSEQRIYLGEYPTRRQAVKAMLDLIADDEPMWVFKENSPYYQEERNAYK